MKKKILLTLLIVSVLVCVFAISISAVTYTYKDADGNTLFSYNYDTVTEINKDKYGANSSAWIASNKQGVGFAKEDADGNELTWYITNTETDEAGNKTFTVASLKTMGEAGDINGSGAYNFTSPVTKKNTVSVNFPDDAGITSFGFGSFGGNLSYFENNILFVYCPNTLTTFSNSVFQETPVMVVELDDETPITNIPQNFAHEARNLTSINIPASVTIINGNGTNNGTPFYRNASLTKVTFASNEKLNEIKTNAFLECISLKECTIPDSLETLGSNAFRKTALVKSPFTVNSNCKYIGVYAFYECKSLTEINIPPHAKYDCTTLKGGSPFQNCTALTTVNFQDDMDNVLFPQYMFSGCTSLVSVKLPNSVTTLPARMFNGCSKLETVVFGAKVTSINNFRDLADGHNSMFFGCSALKYVYLPKTLNIDAETHSDACHVFYSGGNITFFYDGNEEQALALQNQFKNNVTSCKNNGKITGAEIISLENYEKLSEIKKCYIVWGNNTCKAFYNNEHNIVANEGSTCLGECKNCGEPQELANAEHKYAYVFNGGNEVSLLATITVKQVCSSCQKEIVEDSIPAIFENYGSSSSMTGVGVHQKTKVNEKALADYAKLTGNENVYNYGIFAGVAVDKDGTEYDGNLVSVNGTAVSATNPEKSVVASFAKTDYTILTIKITGVTAGDQIYFGTFATVGNNVTYVTGNTEGNKAEAQTIA